MCFVVSSSVRYFYCVHFSMSKISTKIIAIENEDQPAHSSRIVHPFYHLGAIIWIFPSIVRLVTCIFRALSLSLFFTFRSRSHCHRFGFIFTETMCMAEWWIFKHTLTNARIMTTQNQESEQVLGFSRQ